MKKEDLTALGLTEEQTAEVLKLSDADTKALNETISTLEGEKKALENEKGKGSVSKEEIKKLEEAAYEKGKQEVQKDFDSFKTEQALSAEIKKAGAKNEKAVKALLDMEGIKYENGTFTGLSEQLEAVKKGNEYLFNGETKEKKPTFSGSAQGDEKITKESFAKMSYKEQVKLYNENPELYKKLAEE